MTVAFDAFSNPTAGTGTLTWDHNPVGTPRGVLVYVVEVAATDGVTGVTYGGTSMTEVAGSPNECDTAGTDGVVHCFFLGSSVPTDDPAEIVVSISGSITRQAGAITATAVGDTEVVDGDGSICSISLENPSVTLSLASRTCFASIGFSSGRDSAAGITPLTSWTGQLEEDFGTQVAGFYTYDTIGSSDVTAGWTQGGDGAAMIAVAISESSGPHAFSDGTRLGQMPVGTRPYAGFVAKTAGPIASGRILRNNPMIVSVGKMMNR